jgi:hypothetical protein
LQDDDLVGAVFANKLSSAGASLSSYRSDPESLAFIQAEQWTLTKPGANPERQEAPHPHQAITDPTGDYIVVPDLGADLVRIFKVDKATLTWNPVAPLVAAPGDGPRHGVFLVAGGKTFFYVVNELSNTIKGFAVTYNANNTLGFTEIYASNTHGPGGSVPAGTKASEIVLTVRLLAPEPCFLLLSPLKTKGQYTLTRPSPARRSRTTSSSSSRPASRACSRSPTSTPRTAPRSPRTRCSSTPSTRPRACRRSSRPTRPAA